MSDLAHERKIKAANEALDKGIALYEQRDAAQGILWMARSFETAPADAADLRGLIYENLTKAHRQIHPWQQSSTNEAGSWSWLTVLTVARL